MTHPRERLLSAGDTETSLVQNKMFCRDKERGNQNKEMKGPEIIKSKNLNK